MTELGKKQVLMIVKTVDFGVYLGTEEERVLLPKKEVPEGVEIGDPVEVFLYKDSEDRLIATTLEPALVRGEMQVLKVKDINRFGAFLDWGLPKDLFLPFGEQTGEIRVGDEILVRLYIDKSERLSASMHIYENLSLEAPYEKDDVVEGRVYEVLEDYGVYVAVDDRYSARIPKRECFKELRPGEIVRARVAKVKEDGKLDLSLRAPKELQMDVDAARIMKKLEAEGGYLPLYDKSSPEAIKAALHMSKAGFKRAIGRLYKEGYIDMTGDGIKVKEKAGE